MSTKCDINNDTGPAVLLGLAMSACMCGGRFAERANCQYTIPYRCFRTPSGFSPYAPAML